MYTWKNDNSVNSIRKTVEEEICTGNKYDFH